MTLTSRFVCQAKTCSTLALACIDALADDPRGEGCIKLSGKEQYRVRQGFYRIVYEIEDDRLVVLVIKVAHRSGIYKNS